MRLIIVRHGETEENITGIMQGQTYGVPSEEGKRQNVKLAERLKEEKMDVIFSSDLLRTKETTEQIRKFHSCPVHYVKELREKSHGLFEGLHKDEMKKAREESGIPQFQFKPEGGENYLDLRERAKGFIEEILKKHKGETVLVVSHGALIRAMLSYLLKIPIEEAPKLAQDNTAVNIIEIKEDRNEAHLINSVDHL